MDRIESQEPDVVCIPHEGQPDPELPGLVKAHLHGLPARHLPDPVSAVEQDRRAIFLEDRHAGRDQHHPGVKPLDE